MSRRADAPVYLGILLLLLAGVLTFALFGPLLTGGGPTKRAQIVNNLIAIEMVKEMWASDHGITGSVQITEQDLGPHFRGRSISNGLVTPVMGERYVINPSGVAPEAHLTRKYGKWPPGTIIRHPRGQPIEIILPQGGENGRQPFRSQTNRTPAEAASDPSP